MSRVIKFRAWINVGVHRPNPRMVECSPVLDSSTIAYKRANGSMSYVTPIALMQFTGLFDKNKKEIYEGDIIRLSIGGDLQDGPLVVDDLNLHLGLHDKDHYLRIDDRSLEVIGNIYENPELIK